MKSQNFEEAFAPVTDEELHVMQKNLLMLAGLYVLARGLQICAVIYKEEKRKQFNSSSLYCALKNGRKTYIKKGVFGNYYWAKLK